MNDSCAKVFCRRSGDRSGPVKNERLHVVRQHALAADRAGAAAPAGHAARHVRRRGVAAVVERVRRPARAFVARTSRARGRRSRPVIDVARAFVARPTAECRRPRLRNPTRRCSRSRIEAGALIDDVGRAVVLPRHLVLAHQLHADRPPDGLRHQRRVVRHRVGAVQAIAARAPREDRRGRSPAAGRAASPRCFSVGYTACVGDQIVALSPCTSATAHDVPIDPCI